MLGSADRIRARRGGDRTPAFEAPDPQSTNQPRLAAERLVDRVARDARCPGDRADRRLGISALEELPARGIEDHLARGVRLVAASPRIVATPGLDRI